MLVLASKSQRRKEILDQTGLEYKIIESPYIEEDNKILKDDPQKYVELLSFNKALAVFNNHQDDLIIGADTIVVLEKQILEKPHDKADAFRMLRALSDKTHKVLTSVTLINKNKTITFTCVSSVTFKSLTDDQINEYIVSEEPMDKAGAYAIQGIGRALILEYQGDILNIIGLPLNELLNVLSKEFHLNIDKK